MEQGWIKLWRKTLASDVWQNKNLWRVWSWCLMKACHRETWVPVQTGRGFTQVLLRPGQLIFGRHASAGEIGLQPSSVRNLLLRLKFTKNLDIQPDKHFSIITIINWDIYQINNATEGQANGQAKDTQRTGKGHIQEYKECKELKKEKEYSSIFLQFWEVYPKKVQRVAAYKEWQKTNGSRPEITLLIEIVKKQIAYKDQLRASGQFCSEWPDPQRWIKNKRWEDETNATGPGPGMDAVEELRKKIREQQAKPKTTT